MIVSAAEYEFLKSYVEKVMKENDENLGKGGIMYPFLFTNQGVHSRLIRAKLIKTKRPPYFCCFTCLTILGRHNGVFFSADQTELDVEGYLTISFMRVHVDITFAIVQYFDDESVELDYSITLNEESLENRFKWFDALLVGSKEMLVEYMGS